MNYEETLEWMFSRLPMYQQQGNSAYKANLNNILKFTAHLQHPEKKLKTVHVAGTNGKGSTSHMIASILQEAGYKTGLYTSPHLKDFRERIRINGNKISEKSVIDFIRIHKKFIEQHSFSFFEITVAMAFWYFSEQNVDIAVVEVGLGGRLDSTNIITPEVSVITNIGMDHTQILGDSLAQIANEKAGIIKQNIPVVIGRKQEETTPVFEKIATNLGSKLYFTEEFEFPSYPLDLLGSYQQENSRTARQTIEILNAKNWQINEKAIKNGLGNVVTNTGLLGRWQVLQEHPKVICDTAHNTDGLIWVIKQLQKEEYMQLHIVFGMVEDKSRAQILVLLPEDAKYYFTKPSIPRGLSENVLKHEAAQYDLTGESFQTVAEAFTRALKQSNPEDLIFVGGSTFVVAEIV